LQMALVSNNKTSDFIIKVYKKFFTHSELKEIIQSSNDFLLIDFYEYEKLPAILKFLLEIFPVVLVLLFEPR